jgi:DNA-binding ferritin-like protein
MMNGPSFLELHQLTGDQYEKLRQYGDVFAEHVRILGMIPPLTMNEMGNTSVI